MKTSILLVGRTRDRTVQQPSSVGGSAEKAGQLLGKIQKFREAALKQVDRSVGVSQSSTRYSLPRRIYCETEKGTNYPVKCNHRFLRDYLVLGMNSDRVGKDCLKVRNGLTFKEAHDMAKSEESADKQLQLE